MRFTVSLSLLVLGSVDWILYQLDTVGATFTEEYSKVHTRITSAVLAYHRPLYVTTSNWEWVGLALYYT